MMDFDGQTVRDEFMVAFEMPITKMTTAQLKWLIKVGKHIRGRCRSNIALRNYLNRNFIGHDFKDVPVPGKDYTTIEVTTK